MGDFLQDRFGISVEDTDLWTKDFEYTSMEKNKIQDILDRYEEKILSQASKERHNYLEYLKSVGLTSDFAVVDSQLYGTIQYYLGKLLGKKLKGFYFCVCKDKSNIYLEQNLMWGCFPGKKELDGKDSSIYKNGTFIEAFFTAPNGMFQCIEDDGEKRYAEKKQNQINFDIRWNMLVGIQEFLEDAVKFCSEYHVNIGAEDIYFADKMFGVSMNNGVGPTEKMKNGFYYDNGMAGHKETPIWD